MNQGLFNQARPFILILALFVIADSSLHGSELIIQGDLSEVVRLAGVSPETSALLIVRLEDGAQWVSGGPRIDIPYPPASTAKIPHTLIALEEGYVDGPDAYFEWDEDDAVKVAGQLRRSMTEAFIELFPGYSSLATGLVEIGIGNTWEDAK